MTITISVTAEKIPGVGVRITFEDQPKRSYLYRIKDEVAQDRLIQEIRQRLGAVLNEFAASTLTHWLKGRQ